MSTIKTVNDDIFQLFKNAIQGEILSSSSSSSNSTFLEQTEIKIVKDFTYEDIEEKQIAISTNSLTNLLHPGVFDYQIAVTIQGQTFVQNDPQKAQILQLFGYVMEKIQGLTIDDYQIYIDNCVGFQNLNTSLDSDGETNTFTIEINLYVIDLI